MTTEAKTVGQKLQDVLLYVLAAPPIFLLYLGAAIAVYLFYRRPAVREELPEVERPKLET